MSFKCVLSVWPDYQYNRTEDAKSLGPLLFFHYIVQGAQEIKS